MELSLRLQWQVPSLRGMASSSMSSPCTAAAVPSRPTRLLETRNAAEELLPVPVLGPQETECWHHRPAEGIGLGRWDAQLGSGIAGLSGSASTSTSGNEGAQMGSMDGQLTEAVESLELLTHVRTSSLYRVLKWCMVEKNLVLGKRVHALCLKCGYASDTFLANHIICMYASLGRLDEARQVFNNVAGRDCYMWASIILAHAKHGQPMEAMELYREMRGSAVEPDNHVFVAVLKACAAGADFDSGKEVHADIKKNGKPINMYVGSCLVDMYAKCGSLDDARLVFDALPEKNVVIWNAMVGGYARHGLGQEAIALYASMQQEGNSSANQVTYVCVLQACACTGALEQGKQLHARIRLRGLEADTTVGNCLVNMYAKCGSLDEARKVFDTLPKRDVGTWNAMIAGYAQHGLGEEALALYDNMQQNAMIPADEVTFTCILEACASVGALHQGKQVHAEIQRRKLECDVIIGSCLVDMYAKCGSLVDARRVFDELPSKNVVAWTAMITGYAQHELGQEALALYSSMQQDGLNPANRVTFVCLLQACASVGALHQGKQLHALIQEKKLHTDIVVGNSLVRMYAKCGNLLDAHRVFDSLPTRDVVTWNALLNGYAEHSDGRMAIQIFEQMQQQGVEPDDATFACLLVACSHEGLVNEGQRYFNIMVDDHGIVPSVYHYSCMVDLFGRSGHLDAAEEILLTMPSGNYVVGWTSLLSACKSHGDIERGRRCFERLIAMEPENGTAYVLLASIYANAGKWVDARRIEMLRKNAGAKKKPAKACIEVKREVHEFTVGEERADLKLTLRSINLNLKKAGHLPQTDLVLNAVSQGEKEAALCGHAEKLALAYGLLNTPEGTTLLVTKNLRMCNDCHSGTKIMSRIERREIVVRDAHRVHRFTNGSCSCGDRH